MSSIAKERTSDVPFSRDIVDYVPKSTAFNLFADVVIVIVFFREGIAFHRILLKPLEKIRYALPGTFESTFLR